MRPGAHVNSIESLEALRAALCVFGEEVDQSLSTIDSEIRDFVNWLEHDRLQFWKREIRAREEKVGEAKTDLHRCLAATIDANRTPSCYQEKKVLEAAKRCLQEAEAKFAAVRRWIPIVRQAVFEYGLKVDPLKSAVAADVPAGMSFLGAAVSRLVDYLNVAPPSATVTTANPSASTAANSARVALPADEQPPPRSSAVDPVEALSEDQRETIGEQSQPSSVEGDRA